MIEQLELKLDEQIAGHIDAIDKLHAASAQNHERLAPSRDQPKIKPKEPGPADQLEASFEMERLKGLSGPDFVDEYQKAIASGNYLTRKACEAVAGHVLKGDERGQAYFKVAKDGFYNPQTDEIKAAVALTKHLGRLSAMTRYISNYAKERGKLAFVSGQ
jgi:hypothetical protein